MSEPATKEELEELRGRLSALEGICVVLLKEIVREPAGRDLIANNMLSLLTDAGSDLTGPYSKGFSELVMDFERKLRGG